jgi:hypothetical protein
MMRLWPWRKPTRQEQYDWLMAEYGPYGVDENLKKTLGALVKMETLYRRIRTEQALLAKDIELARQFDIDTEWVKSPAENIRRGKL